MQNIEIHSIFIGPRSCCLELSPPSVQNFKQAVDLFLVHRINKGLANIYTIRYSNVSITLPNAVGVYASAFFLRRVVPTTPPASHDRKTARCME